ncbi:MAG: VCBS repeat-containing protein [Planctomycetes bacterium]|nr:VCBS repeat-containing protein [Planctomycetota bacterium]
MRVFLVCVGFLAGAAGSPLEAADCDRNGVDDWVDVSGGTSPDCNGNLTPDACDLQAVNFGLLPRAPALVASALQSLAAADVTGDGRADILGADVNAARVLVSTNRGGGLFSAFGAQAYAAGGLPHSMALGDLDGDGDRDLAVTNPRLDRLSVLRNGGSGSFGAPESHAAAGAPTDIEAADLDGDGRLDLAVALAIGEELAVFRGDGAGGFAAPATYASGGPLTDSSRAIALGDLDRDGDLDLLLGLEPAVGASLFLNAGGGTLLAAAPAGVAGSSLALADFDGDGALDLAAAGRALEVRRGSGRGSFEAAAALRFEGDRYDLAAGDLDGDGDPDLAVSGSRLLVFLRAAGGTFAPPRAQPFEHATDLAAADLDGAGGVDLAVKVATPAGVAVLPTEEGAVRNSADCDRDGAPDECQPDCDRDGLPDRCEEDCDRSGAADACEVAADPGRDCNSNGVPDACDLASGRSQDLDGDGTPDECKWPEIFTLRFRGPTRVERELDATTIEAVVELETRLAPGITDGAQGWSITICSKGCEITGATTAGTDVPRLFRGGFQKTYLTACPTGTGTLRTCAVSAMVLSFTENVTLDPRESPHDILKVTARGLLPAGGPCARCELSFECQCRGCDPGYWSSITFQGSTYSPTLTSRYFDLCSTRFLRGDANSDFQVDISDAIRTFMYLFLGAKEPGCLDAADTTDDGRVDISDGIAILLDFFRPGTGIPDPGPFYCGEDPSPDALACRRYPFCEELEE